MSILHFLNMMLCQFFSLHTPFHIWWHNIEEYKRTLMTKPLNNDHFKISNSPILILTWKYIRINTSNKLPKHIVWFQQTFSTWTIRLMPWLRIKKKKNKYLLSKDQWNQNYYFTLFQSFISSMCGNFLLLVHELMSFFL